MNKLISIVISKIKREPFYIDTNIPANYLLILVFNRFIMLMRGCLCFPFRRTRIYIGNNTVLKARSVFSFGKNVTISANCYIDSLSSDGVVLGDNVSLGKNITIEATGSIKTIGKGLKVGSNVGLGSYNFFGCAGGIEIGDDTIMGNFISMHSENHNYENATIPIRLQGVNHKGIKIGNNCWIGAKVTILDGAIVEDGCIIAAGALLTEGRYQENGIYGGVPAKLLKTRKYNV
jgi:acetyltransferase-like isoleucine patch superfamily enzyme